MVAEKMSTTKIKIDFLAWLHTLHDAGIVFMQAQVRNTTALRSQATYGMNILWDLQSCQDVGL
jgi:hypothetical protein